MLDKTRSFQISKDIDGLKNLDPLAYVRTVRFGASVFPHKFAVVVETAAGFAETGINYERGKISFKEYLSELGMISAGAATSIRPEARGFGKSLKHEAKQVGENVQSAFQHLMQGQKPAYAFSRTEGRAFSKRSFSSGNLPKSETSWFFEGAGREVRLTMLRQLKKHLWLKLLQQGQRLIMLELIVYLPRDKQ